MILQYFWPNFFFYWFELDLKKWYDSNKLLIIFSREKFSTTWSIPISENKFFNSWNYLKIIVQNKIFINKLLDFITILPLLNDPFNNNISILESKIIYFCLRPYFCECTSLTDVISSFEGRRSEVAMDLKNSSTSFTRWLCMRKWDTEKKLLVWRTWIVEFQPRLRSNSQRSYTFSCAAPQAISQFTPLPISYPHLWTIRFPLVSKRSLQSAIRFFNDDS